MPGNKVTFEQLCDGEKGYVLETGETIKKETITKATKIVFENIEDRIEAIEEVSGKKVKHFYIGKSHIREKTTTFKRSDPDTWRLAGGVNQRYTDLSAKDYGKDGLMVVAVVTKKSIPKKYKANKGYNHEEYALELKKRLMEKYKEENDKRLANPTTQPGRRDEEESIGYVIYIAFAFKPTRKSSPLHPRTPRRGLHRQARPHAHGRHQAALWCHPQARGRHPARPQARRRH